MSEAGEAQEDRLEQRGLALVLENVEVDGEDFLDQVVVILRGLSEVKPDRIRLFQLLNQLLLHLAVVTVLALLSELIQLLLHLLGLLAGLVDHLGLLLVDDDLVGHEAVEEVGVHQAMFLALDRLRELLENLYLEIQKGVVFRAKQVEDGSGDLVADGEVLGSEPGHHDLEDVETVVEVRLRFQQFAIGEEAKFSELSVDLERLHSLVLIRDLLLLNQLLRLGLREHLEDLQVLTV